MPPLLPLLTIDDGNRANGAIGSNYTTVFGGASVQIASNQFQGATTGTYASAIYNAVSFGADSYAGITITAGAAASLCELYVRSNSFSAPTNYYYTLLTVGQTPKLDRVLASADTLIGTGSENVAVGDTYVLTAVGSLITVWRLRSSTWTAQVQVTNSDVAAGGYIGFDTFGTTLDNFLGGNITVGSVPVGGSLAGGTAPVSRISSTIPQGGTSAGGTAPNQNIGQAAPPGGTAAGGTAPGQSLSQAIPPGGSLAGGTAPQGAVSSTIPPGGSLAGGTAPGQSFSQAVPPGGSLAGGTEPQGAVSSTIPPGGTAAGGTAPTSTTYSAIPPGGTLAGGTAPNQNIAQAIPPGGTLAGGVPPAEPDPPPFEGDIPFITRSSIQLDDAPGGVRVDEVAGAFALDTPAGTLRLTAFPAELSVDDRPGALAIVPHETSMELHEAPTTSLEIT